MIADSRVIFVICKWVQISGFLRGEIFKLQTVVIAWLFNLLWRSNFLVDVCAFQQTFPIAFELHQAETGLVRQLLIALWPVLVESSGPAPTLSVGENFELVGLRTKASRQRQVLALETLRSQERSK